MKKQLLAFSLLAMALFSCDKEEEVPNLLLEGSYETLFLTTADDPGFSTVMTFSTTGNLLIERFVTVEGSNEPCLIDYSEGTYTLKGEEFTSTLTSYFGPDPTASDLSEGCIPKDQLVDVLSPMNSSFSGFLTLDDSKESFILGYSCNDMLATMSSCLGPQTFTKVE